MDGALSRKKQMAKFQSHLFVKELFPAPILLTWDSEIDTLSLKHEAKNRKGFALGAVVAAEFIHTRKGVFTMSDVLGF